MNPNKRNKLQQILNALNGKSQATTDATNVYRQSVLEAESKLKDAITAANLDEVNKKFADLQKQVDLTPIKEGLIVLQNNAQANHEEFSKQLEEKYQELEQLAQSGDLDLDRNMQDKANGLMKEIADLQDTFIGLNKVNSDKIEEVGNSVASITDSLKKLATKKIVTELRNDFETYKLQDENQDKQLVADLEKKIQSVQAKLLSELGNRGGSMNRQVFINGVDPLTKWTDLNLKAGSNVTITYANNNATHQVDVTIAATGGGGGGTVRSINSISASTTAAAASQTDYVYLCTGTLTLTLPDATASNTNLYTVKNVGSGTVTVATTAAQTVDGNSTVTMPIQYTSVDLISDTLNWNIT